MTISDKPKRRNKVDKRLNNAAIKKREQEAEKRNIPRLKDFSLAINQRLLDLEKNQEWLVEETGIGKATISAYYNAESMPNGVNLIKLADALQTTPDYLLGFTNSPSTDITVKAIHEKTGLSKESIEYLEDCFKKSRDNSITKTLNRLLKDRELLGYINLILQYSMEPEEEIIDAPALVTEDGEPLISIGFKYKGIEADSWTNSIKYDPDGYYELLGESDIKKIYLLKIQEVLQRMLKEDYKNS